MTPDTQVQEHMLSYIPIIPMGWREQKEGPQKQLPLAKHKAHILDLHVIRVSSLSQQSATRRTQ